MESNHHRISDELLAAFLDGNVNENEANMVLSEIGHDKELTEILSLSELIDFKAQNEGRRIIPMRALAAANPDNLCSFDCETFILGRLDYDIDNWSLLETAKANNWIHEDGTPLHHVGRLLELKGLLVERKYDAAPADIAKALGNGRQVIAIVDKNLLEAGGPKGGPDYHAIYVTGVEGDGKMKYLDLDSMREKTIGKDMFIDAWKCSSYYMVTAEKSSDGYNPQPIAVEDIILDTDLEELTEAIAENAHDIWARARMDEGWTYGPVRDDAQRHHPDLVPYAQLPESEKEYDRIMAMNTLRLVHRLGFDIVKNIDDCSLGDL